MLEQLQKQEKRKMTLNILNLIVSALIGYGLYASGNISKAEILTVILLCTIMSCIMDISKEIRGK